MNTEINEKWILWETKATRCIYAVIWVLLVAFSLFYTDIALYANERVEQQATEQAELQESSEQAQVAVAPLEKLLINKVNKIVVPVLIALMLFLADYVYTNNQVGKNILIGMIFVILCLVLSLILHFGIRWFIGGIFVALLILKWYNTPLMVTVDNTPSVRARKPRQQSNRPRKG